MTSKKFEEEYAKLNTKQKEAVDTIEGPVMVIAGPGTGKTTILTLRIANILRLTDTPPSGILALTFTDAGVKAMQMKLREIIGDRALEVPIYTFHGFAASVINEFQDHFPHLSKSKQITEVESEMILRKILKQPKFRKLRPLGDPDFYIGKILSTISDAKGEAWTPEMLTDFAKTEIERIKGDEASISTRGASKGELKGEALKRIEKCERTILFSEVYAEYEAQKKEDFKMDFDDLLFELLKTLREDKLLLQMLQEKYLYILVDEHQDTNDAQNLIVRLIADFFESPNLFVVGDEKQAIYRFQGASVENFLRFQNIWADMRLISLIENYRSHQSILDASFKMIEQNYTENELVDLRVALKGRGAGDPLALAIAPDLDTENLYLLKNIKQILDANKEATIAIIVRKNKDVSQILSFLEINGIAASAERGANIFADPIGALLFSLIEFLADPEKTEALAETFAGGLWSLELSKQIQIIKTLKSGDLKKVGESIPELSDLQKQISHTGPLEYLALAATVSGFDKIASQSPLGAEVWRMIFELARHLAETNNLEDPRELIKSLLAYKKSAERKTIKIKSGALLSRVVVMTAHSSKGLEFDYVFLPYTTEENWLRKNRSSYFVLPQEKDDLDDLRDDRRLFYVALTRAKKHVFISYASEEGLGKTNTPLRFIDELDQNHISNTLLEKEKAITTRSLESQNNNLEKEKIGYTKRVLLENGLSVTALNHFLKCPSEFFYKSILKLPEAPTTSSEKGTAMHEALSNVWKNLTPSRSTRPSPSEFTKIIQTSVTNYFKHSLLDKFEKETVLDELLTNAQKVAEALQEHFAQKGNIATEKWVETLFNYTYPPSLSSGVAKEEIELRLHGKLDTIIETEKEILVFDYKTREAMGVNAIKGETKDSDGNYFRQLIFYKMLLEIKEKPVLPALVFVKPDTKGNCPTISLQIEESDVERVHCEIKKLIDSVWSGKMFQQNCSEKDCKYCGWKNL